MIYDNTFDYLAIDYLFDYSKFMCFWCFEISLAEAKFLSSVMTVLFPYSVRTQARHLKYREVPSYDDRVLSFVHDHKAGCGGWKHKVQCYF